MPGLNILIPAFFLYFAEHYPALNSLFIYAFISYLYVMEKRSTSARIAIPSFITLLNWFAGTASILCATQGYMTEAALLIVVAALFDFFDGMIARLLNAQSEIGVQLDSLADSVSFGIAPGFIIYHYLDIALVDKPALALLAFIPSAAAVVRLAIFNAKQSKSYDFTGLASPAFAIFVVGIVLSFILIPNCVIWRMEDNPFFWIAISVVFAVLMLSPLKMFSLKFKHLRWKENELRYIFLIISFLMFPFLRIIALPLVIVLYILMSVVYHIKNKNNK